MVMVYKPDLSEEEFTCVEALMLLPEVIVLPVMSVIK
jgi:hypothetical protein